MHVYVCECVRACVISLFLEKEKVTDMFTNRPNIHISKTQIKLKKKRKKRSLVFAWFFYFFFLLLRATAGILFRVGGGFQCVQKRKKQKTLKFQLYSSQMMKSWNKKKTKKHSLLHPVPTPTPINILYFLSETQIYRERKWERKKKSNLFL